MEPPASLLLETHRGVAYPWFCDSMGHMNTQHYCAMFDAATFHYLASLCGLAQLKAQGFGWADRRQTITYEKEVLAGSLVIIRTGMQRIGRTSITYLHRMYDIETGILHATSENVTVLFDLNRRIASPLTPEISAAAERQFAQCH